ncbi:PadR family transcriptional regulator [Yinghuangia soli]|uniref:PadR family transcriptional regulator n=1 Tax=Yinghuangia soli TaxID=2908204 RepID=A0AA41Q7K2_9ACTN|nr:PadR family transcriptional regulator [Yinghuangia soli]MCF2532973.1 PadR family transcriptional regulator [Yinghuangia soli]
MPNESSAPEGAAPGPAAASSAGRTLTTTSYAILALLAVRPWTPYELAQQMDRSMRWLTPRSASVVYEEPKRLVADGLAEAAKEFTGKRGRTVYGITEAGREVLRAWLAGEAGPADARESDLLRIAVADLGELDDLRRTLARMRADADERLAQTRARAAEYQDTGGPFPARLPVISLVTRMFLEQSEAMARWAAWAEEAVAEWDGVTRETGARVPDDAFGEAGSEARE